jgi:hypothetical protein
LFSSPYTISSEVFIIYRTWPLEWRWWNVRKIYKVFPKNSTGMYPDKNNNYLE